MTRANDNPRSPFWPNLSSNAKELARASQLAQEMLSGNPFFIGGALFDRALSMDPLAWANQHQFALSRSTPPSQPWQPSLVAKIALSDGIAMVGRPASPVGRLLPRGSADARQRGEWLIPGSGNPVELALLLMSLGFVWSQTLQEELDRLDSGAHGPALMSDLRSIVEARELEGLPRGSTGKSSGSRL